MSKEVVVRGNQVLARPEAERYYKWYRDRSRWAVLVGPCSREQSPGIADTVTVMRAASRAAFNSKSSIELCCLSGLSSWDLHPPYFHSHPYNQPPLFEVIRGNLWCLQRHNFINPRSPSELKSHNTKTNIVCMQRLSTSSEAIQTRSSRIPVTTKEGQSNFLLRV